MRASFSLRLPLTVNRVGSFTVSLCLCPPGQILGISHKQARFFWGGTLWFSALWWPKKTQLENKIHPWPIEDHRESGMHTRRVRRRALEQLLCTAGPIALLASSWNGGRGGGADRMSSGGGGVRNVGYKSHVLAGVALGSSEDKMDHEAQRISPVGAHFRIRIDQGHRIPPILDSTRFFTDQIGRNVRTGRLRFQPREPYVKIS